MVKDQMLDEDLMPIYIAVEEGTKPHFQEVVQYGPRTRTLWHMLHSLALANRLLWRRVEHRSGDPEKAEMLLVLPRKHVKKTIVTYHSQLGVTNHF